MNRKSEYRTRQQEAVLGCLKENGGAHMTAMDLVNRLSQIGQPVGVATVYRCLEKLTEQGVARKYALGEDGACYQYMENPEDCAEHFHLKCVKCGRLIHVGCEAWRELDQHILAQHHFRVDHVRTVLYGECEDCINQGDKQV